MTSPKRKPGKGPSNARSAARMAAVQALYQMDVAGTNTEDVIHEFVTIRFPSKEAEAIRGADPQFFSDILRGVVRTQRDIDPMIDQALASGWRLVRVDSILRAILRAGVFELKERPDVPAKVAINEYINVAHAFFDEDEPRVVNGILDRLARLLRADELAGSGAKPPPAATGTEDA